MISSPIHAGFPSPRQHTPELAAPFLHRRQECFLGAQEENTAGEQGPEFQMTPPRQARLSPQHGGLRWLPRPAQTTSLRPESKSVEPAFPPRPV